MTLKYFNVKNGLTTGNIILNAGNSNISASTFIGNINVTNLANLGSISNVKITGGAANYVISTDGAGNLTWIAQSGGGGGGAYNPVLDTFAGTGSQADFTLSVTPATIYNTIVNIDGVSQLHDAYSLVGSTITFDSAPSNGAVIEVLILATTAVGGTPGGSNTQVQYNNDGNFGGSAGLTFNSTTTLLTSNNLVVSSSANLGSVSNVTITGGTTGQYLQTDGAGNLSWSTVVSGSTSNISNGNSNVNIATANGNVTISSAGNSNVVVVTGTGINVAGTINVTGNANIGNIGATNGVFTNVSGNGSALTSITGANITGEVAYAATANSVAVANVSGIGNIATVNLDGNSSNILYGNGVFATAPVTYGNSNVATFLANFGSNTLTTTGNVTVGNIIGNGQALTGINGSNVTGQVANALVAGTVYTNAQPNITSVGTLTDLNVSGNAVFGGNLTVDGNLVYVNVTDLSVEDPIIQLQTGPNAAAPTSNSGKDVGTALNYYDTSAKIAFMGWDVSNAEFGFGNTVSISGEVVTFTSYGNIRAGYFIGNGSQLTGITSAAYANYIANGTSNVSIPVADGNINLSASGNANVVVVTGSGINVSGTITTSGSGGNLSGANYVIANYFSGSGNNLSNIQAANISGTVANSNYSLYAGTVLTNAQPNITSVGTLSSLTVTGNLSAGNANLGNLTTSNFFSGNGSLLSSLTGANITGQVANALVAGTVYTAAQPNITSVGLLTALSVGPNSSITLTGTSGYVKANSIQGTDGVNAIYPAYSGVTGAVGITGNLTVGIGIAANITANGNVTANYFIGNGSSLTSIAGANVTGQVANATVAGTVYTNAQPNITSVGTLSNLTSNGTINFTNASNVSLGAVGNVKITGGTANYVLSTDGSGNLSWVAQSGGGGGAANITIESEGNVLTSSVATIDFVGTGVTATNVGNVVTITIPAALPSTGSYSTRTYTGDGNAVSYTISNGLTVSSVIVALNGVLQTPTSDYTVSSNVLTFTSAPAANEAIQIRELGTPVGGSNTQIQFNDEGGFGGNANLTFDKTTGTLNAINITANGTPLATTGKAIAMAIVFGF